MRIAGQLRSCLFVPSIRLQEIASRRVAPLDQGRKLHLANLPFRGRFRSSGFDEAIHFLAKSLALAFPVPEGALIHLTPPRAQRV
jgi:hypothetical protein